MTSELHGPERELEQVLLGLQPSSPGLDHDLVMFRAGQTAVRRRLRVWQGSTAALLAGLTILVFGGPRDQPKPGPVPVESRWAATPASEAPAAGSYAALRTRVLEQGVDALPLPEARGPMPSAKDAMNL
jgi:hypothetical protein